MWVAAGLVALAVLDGAFAGFRSSCGRSALIRHRRQDATALARGLALVTMLLGPVVAVVVVDVAVHAGRFGPYAAAGRAMLAVYLPYGCVVLLALVAYRVLSWRRRFLASALVLGPFTLVRPLVAVSGAVSAAWTVRDALVAALALGAVAAVLAVEPVADRRWYRRLGPAAV